MRADAVENSTHWGLIYHGSASVSSFSSVVVLGHADELVCIGPNRKVLVVDIAAALAILAKTPNKSWPFKDGVFEKYKDVIAFFKNKNQGLPILLAAKRTTALIKKEGYTVQPLPTLVMSGDRRFRTARFSNAANSQIIVTSKTAYAFTPDQIVPELAVAVNNAFVAAGVPRKNIKEIRIGDLYFQGGQVHCATQVSRKPFK